MTVTTLSSREFDKHADRAKKAAKDGPVFINERGEPIYVLLTIENYQQLRAERGNAASEAPLVSKSPPRNNSKMSIVDMLGMPPGTEDVELEIPRDYSGPRPADFD